MKMRKFVSNKFIIKYNLEHAYFKRVLRSCFSMESIGDM
ncbi:hypothetical protein BACCIP111899_04275 [Bacillus rhizoplanae]|uniref:Uncharacterized protein n=1 Tax=Bacillus rhizoplanae TaxID=2880966 RepID=A0ABM8YGQ6_9BACI|nr:hypothetical protein BACCIP111899_04275 [Bacillus rhizoplanae]